MGRIVEQGGGSADAEGVAGPGPSPCRRALTSPALLSHLPPFRRDGRPFCHHLRERGEVREVDVHDILMNGDPPDEALDDPALLRDVHRLPLVREVPGLAHDVLLHHGPDFEEINLALKAGDLCD